MIVQLDTENADRNLTASITVLTDTPDASNPMICQGLVMLGDGTKNLDGTGGIFELVITVGGQTVQPSPQEVLFGPAIRSSVWTSPFPVPANAEVVLKVKSPNSADTDVDITAYLYDVSAAGSASTIVNEFETQSQADPTGFHVNVKEVNGTAQTANDNSADINAILVDTGTTLPATLTAIEDNIDTIGGIVDAILEDTGTTIPAMLTIIDSEIGVIDGIVDAILVDTGTTLPGLIGTVDTNVDTLIVRVPSEVAQKLHLVNGSGDITPPTDKGIWDSLGDGTVAISGTIDASIIEIKGVAGDATKLAKMLYTFANKVIETKTETGSTLAIRNDADDADAYTITITETSTTRTRTAIS